MMNTDINVIYPVPSPDGTDPAELLENTVAVALSLMELLSALNKMAPSARDYVGHGPDWRDKFAKAETEHASRVGTIQVILREIEAIGAAILDANGNGLLAHNMEKDNGKG